MKRILLHRLRRRGGFTLAELLLAVLILLLVTAVVAAALPAAVQSYTNAVNSANAQVYLSTVMSSLRDELGTAENIKVSDTSITYIDAHGVEATLEIDGDGGIFKTVGEGEDASSSSIVPRPASGNSDMYATILKGSSAKEISYLNGVITFGQVAVVLNGKTLAKSDGYQIRVMNPPHDGV